MTPHQGRPYLRRRGVYAYSVRQVLETESHAHRHGESLGDLAGGRGEKVEADHALHLKEQVFGEGARENDGIPNPDFGAT